MFTLTIKTGNAAFDDRPELELARLLRKAASMLRMGDVTNDGDEHYLLDANGTTVGTFTFSPDEEI